MSSLKHWSHYFLSGFFLKKIFRGNGILSEIHGTLNHVTNLDNEIEKQTLSFEGFHCLSDFETPHIMKNCLLSRKLELKSRLTEAGNTLVSNIHTQITYLSSSIQREFLSRSFKNTQCLQVFQQSSIAITHQHLLELRVGNLSRSNQFPPG